MKFLVCLVSTICISGCVTPKCNCKPVWEFCDALMDIDAKLIEIMQRDAKLNRDEIMSLRKSRIRTEAQRQNTECIKSRGKHCENIDWTQIEKNIEQAAKEAAEKTDAELGVQ